MRQPSDWVNCTRYDEPAGHDGRNLVAWECLVEAALEQSVGVAEYRVRALQRLRVWIVGEPGLAQVLWSVFLADVANNSPQGAQCILPVLRERCWGVMRDYWFYEPSRP